MHPILFQCRFFTIYTYGVFAAVAFFVASTLIMKASRERGLDERQLYTMCVVVLVAGLLTARIFYVVLNWDYFRDHLLDVLMLQKGGLVWFGGLLGGCAAAFLFVRRQKMPLLKTLDIFAPHVALAQAIGRLGCFFNGCCYGRPSAWGFYNPFRGEVLFPSQLLDAATLVFLFFVLRFFMRRERPGETFSLYVTLAATQRFLMEFLRGDPRPFYFSLSLFQWISILLFFLGLTLYVRLPWRKKAIR